MTPPCGVSSVSWGQVPVLILRRSFEPPFNIEHNPLFSGMLAHRPHHQFVGNVVKKAFDIQIKNPIKPPATLPGLSHRVMRGLERPVAIAVSMKEWFELWFQIPFDHHLSHPIRNGRNA